MKPITMDNEKRITDLISIFIYAMFVCVALLLFVFREYWLYPVQIFHISTEILCMAVLTVLYKLHLGKKTKKLARDRYFTALCILLIFSLFLDIISWTIDGSVSTIWLNYIVNALVFLLSFAHGTLFIEYIFSCTDTLPNVVIKLRGIIKKIVLFGFVVRIICIVSGVYFTIGSNGLYQVGNGYILSFFFMPVMTLFVCGVASGCGLSLRRLGMLLSYPLSSLVMLGIAFINIDYANSLISLTLSLILIYCAMFINMEELKSNLNESFQLYISDGVGQSLDEMGSVAPGGSLCHSTMLFCNIHGFGEEMEAMEPEDAVVLLNSFNNSMSELVEREKGRLLEYPGHGLFCIFGEFNGCINHADAAVRTAKLMLSAINEINRKNAENHYPQLKIGIGINTGDVVVGNIGSKNHMRYSAIGKHVNLAGRTETYAGDGEIFLTENTVVETDGKIDAEAVGTIMPKGIEKPVCIYKLRNI